VTDSLAEEAAKLFAAAEEWVREHAPAGAGHTGPECKVCPLCQGLALVRGAQPEVFEHLTEAATALMAAARAMVEAQERSWVRRRSAGAPVERIDIA
jgi:hypothetical protein